MFSRLEGSRHPRGGLTVKEQLDWLVTSSCFGLLHEGRMQGILDIILGAVGDPRAILGVPWMSSLVATIRVIGVNM